MERSRILLHHLRTHPGRFGLASYWLDAALAINATRPWGSPANSSDRCCRALDDASSGKHLAERSLECGPDEVELSIGDVVGWRQDDVIAADPIRAAAAWIAQEPISLGRRLHFAG